MSDYIDIQKIWFDNEVIQLLVVCSSEIITSSAKIYVCDGLIDDLIYQIEKFTNGWDSESYWENDEQGDDSTTCVSFRFIHKDKLGHVLIEVYMELDDGGSYFNHNCCFYVNTEIGLLEKFCEQLPQIKQKTTDLRITLNEIDG